MAALFFLWAGFGLGGEFWELLLLQEACKEYKMALEKAVFFKISVKGRWFRQVIASRVVAV